MTTIFVKGDTAIYHGPAIGTLGSMIFAGEVVTVVEPNLDEDDGVTVILAELGSAAVPAFADPSELEWISGL